jgi:hypothetical protein
VEFFLKLAAERARLSSRELPEVVETVARAYQAFGASRGACRWSLEIMCLGERFGILDETGGTHQVDTVSQAWATADRLLRAKYAELHERSCLLLHAAGVARPGIGAALFVGSEDAGKSTMACVLTAKGWHYLSDELVPVDPEARAQAFPKLPDAEPQMARRIAADCTGLQFLTTGDAPNGYVRLPAGLVLSPGASEPVRLILFLHRNQAADKPSLEPLRGGEPVMTVVQSAFNSHQLGEKGVWLAAKLVESARVFRLSYRDALSQGEDISAQLDRHFAGQAP